MSQQAVDGAKCLAGEVEAALAGLRRDLLVLGKRRAELREGVQSVDALCLYLAQERAACEVVHTEMCVAG
jgi:hypothetical protein